MINNEYLRIMDEPLGRPLCFKVILIYDLVLEVHCTSVYHLYVLYQLSIHWLGCKQILQGVSDLDALLLNYLSLE